MAKYTHPMVRETAKELCGAYHEEMASRDDEFFRYYPNQRMFILRYWGQFVEAAAATLWKLTEDPNLPEGSKIEIRDALVKHHWIYGKNVA